MAKSVAAQRDPSDAGVTNRQVNRSLQLTVPPLRTTMNFNVSENFHREFKTYAAQHGLKMVEVLERSFRILKDHNGS
jgi:hypothetical protein